MNDHVKFLNIVKQFPQVWDRSHPHFRDKTMKEKYWTEMSKICGNTETACKDLFKALREKYLREREKAKQLGSLYIPWPLLENLQFLEPHIVLRKQSDSLETISPAVEEFLTANSDNKDPCDDNEDFDTHLIKLVRKSTPIWDRNTKSFCSKQLKQELWRNIADKLKKDPHYCALRWKALREKYIRQKTKYVEGEGKWYLLDEMSFLDEVIQYRRKQTDNKYSESDKNLHLNIFETFSKEDFGNTNSTSCLSNNEYDNSTYDAENSTSNSLNECPVTIKQEDAPEVPDSSNNELVNKRKYAENEMCESDHSMKIRKLDNNLEYPTPEQVFGNLVAIMLSKKPERDKNIAMVEIMKILTK